MEEPHEQYEVFYGSRISGDFTNGIICSASGRSRSIDIARTGVYYLKTKATILGADPIYQKGNYFEVYVGSDGYSILTITYSIEEIPGEPNPLEGRSISEEEFERDND